MGTLTQSQLGSIRRVLLARLQYPEMCPGFTDILSAALGRMADGTFGICQVCHGKIGAVRLTAAPHAAFCIPCQEERESGSVDRRTVSEEG
jgi:hypothetical protein